MPMDLPSGAGDGLVGKDEQRGRARGAHNDAVAKQSGLQTVLLFFLL